jgi:hypothetical protein
MAPPATITTSKIHEKNLDMDKMFKEAWWLQYCICGGRAVGNVGEPYFGSEVRQMCLHQTCEMTEIGNPFCAEMTVECCITEQCAFPKIEGSPTCVCCNKQLAGGSTDNWNPKLFEFEPKFKDQFWLYYFLCAGVGLNGLGSCTASGKDQRPLFAMMKKELCIKQAAALTGPCQEGVLCSGLGTSLCFWEQFQLPPAPNNPKFACCGWKLSKHPSEDKKGPLQYGK